ncbi:MAG: hypothetical protein HYV41_00205 [Candidatus Magasanikbacteria bacterium]|nr:hypothetical protein [Candidatus Magasanikbacteria bacterium]
MEKIICPIHAKPRRFITWLSRAIAGLFLYTSLTLGDTVTLENTKVVQLIQEEYPSLQSLVFDSVGAFFILGLLALIGFRILKFTEHHHISQKWIRGITRVETKLIRNALTFLYALAHGTIMLLCARIIWKIIDVSLSYLEIPHINVAQFSTQPAVMLMGVCSIALLLNSFHLWNKSLAKLFCIRCVL